MRIPIFYIIAILFVASVSTPALAQATIKNTFTTNMSLGSTGVQVLELQQILNKDIDTRLSSNGPGSPGNETNYFGHITKSAVVRFQEKYRNKVLTPVNLTLGNGYVGFYTRKKLNTLSQTLSQTTNTLSQIKRKGTQPKSQSLTNTAKNPVKNNVEQNPIAIPRQITQSQNPNMVNSDRLFSAIEKSARAKHLSSAKIAKIETQVRKDLATTTDLRATFLKLVQRNSRQVTIEKSVFSSALSTIEQALGMVFTPKKARASIGVPFGGPLLSAFWCTCSKTWLIAIGPLPPTYVELLDYLEGSQAFLSYNIPATNWLLGSYSGGNVCFIKLPKKCLQIPSEGVITPIVGSSPL